jgi:DNA/RNA endonuclease YhcR with UshA esterase domain
LRPQIFSTREIGEATEGRLVRVAGVVTKPIKPDAPYGFRFFVDDGTGEVQIFVSASTNVPTAGLRPGRRVRVTGFSGQYKDHYEVEPRFASDISFQP